MNKKVISTALPNIEKLLNGESTTVYHILASQNDFNSIKINGFKSNSSLAKKTWNNKTYYLSWFSLIKPAITTPNDIKVTLPSGLKIYNLISNEQLPAPELAQKGYDGYINKSFSVLSNSPYELILFNGERFKNVSFLTPHKNDIPQKAKSLFSFFKKNSPK